METKRYKSLPDKFDEDYWFGRDGRSNYHGYSTQEIYPVKLQLAKDLLRRFAHPHRIMVLGSAKGFLVRAFRVIGCQAYGIDISRYAYENSPASVKKFLFVGDISNVKFMKQFKTNYYDLVTAMDVLEHIPMPRLSNAILEAARIAKKWIIINMPVKNVDTDPDDSSWSTDKTHVSIYSPGWWINMFCQQDRHKIIPHYTKGQIELRGANVKHESFYDATIWFEKVKKK